MGTNDSLMYVIFGASGDLAKRKLVPALYSLFVQKLLPEKFVLLGVSRSPLTDEAFRDEMREAIREFKEIDDTSGIDAFIGKL
jgi:glucose-6-phosphate 1-dehydrogenase